MKLADAVAVYEGRRPPRMLQLPIERFVFEFLERAAQRPQPAGHVDYGRFTALNRELVDELELIYPLFPRIKRVAGTRRPRSLSWHAHVETSGNTPFLQNLFIRGVKYRSRRNLTAINIVSYGRPLYGAAHRELAFAAGLDEIDMFALLGCYELGRPRNRWYGNDTSTDWVAPQYVELVNQLGQTSV